MDGESRPLFPAFLFRYIVRGSVNSRSPLKQLYDGPLDRNDLPDRHGVLCRRLSRQRSISHELSTRFSHRRVDAPRAPRHGLKFCIARPLAVRAELCSLFLFAAGQQYKSLEDQKVDRLVWTICVLFCAGAALMFLFALLNVIWGAGGARG